MPYADALNFYAKKPFTLYVKGTIYGTTEADGSGYFKAEINRSNVSIIGIVEHNQTPSLNAVWLYAKGERNLIIRNLRFVAGRDHELKEMEAGCHSNDPDYCDWNAEPDALTVQATQGVWIDHCEFSDDPNYSGINPQKSHYKGFDGLPDIKRGANFVTVSYSKFSNHDKSILIGHSDSQTTDDFHVTFYRNYFSYQGQRAPRVRFGKAHILNNLYENQKKTNYSEKYHLTYAIGPAFQSEIYSEKNVFDIKDAQAQDLIVITDFAKWAQRFTDLGSWLNGAPVNLNRVAKTAISDQEEKLHAGLSFEGPVTWSPAAAYKYSALNTPTEIRTTVKANAGAGIIDTHIGD